MASKKTVNVELKADEKSLIKLKEEINNIKRSLNFKTTKLPEKKLETFSKNLGLSANMVEKLSKKMSTFNANKKMADSFKKITESANLNKKEIRQLQKELNITDEAMKIFDKSTKSSTSSLSANANALHAAKKGFDIFRNTIAGTYVETIKNITELGKTAHILDVPIESLSKLKFAAEASGIGFNELKNGIENFSKNLANGDTESINILKQLGINLKEISEMPVDEAIKKIATSMQSFSSGSQALISEKLFGSSGKELLMLLGKSGEGIDALYGKAESLGAITSDIDYKKMQEAQESMVTLKTAFNSLSQELVLTFAPAITEFVNSINNVIKNIQEYRQIKKEEKDEKTVSKNFTYSLDQREKIIKENVNLQEEISKLENKAKRYRSDDRKLKRLYNELEKNNKELEIKDKEIIIFKAVLTSRDIKKNYLSFLEKANALISANSDGMFEWYEKAFNELFEESKLHIENRKQQATNAPNQNNNKLELNLDNNQPETVNTKIEDSNCEVIEKTESYLDGIKNAFSSYAKEATNAATNVEKAFNNAFSNLEDSLVNFVMTGKFEWKGLIDSMLADLTRLLIRQFITGQIANGIAGFMSHEGSVVGETYLKSRNVDPAVFIGASRMHTGGMVGLRPDEYPIIAQKGEMVLTKEQQKALGANLNNKNQVNIQVINNNNSNVSIKEQQNSTGGMDLEVQLDEAVASVLARRGSRSQQALAQSNRMVMR